MKILICFIITFTFANSVYGKSTASQPKEKVKMRKTVETDPTGYVKLTIARLKSANIEATAGEYKTINVNGAEAEVWPLLVKQKNIPKLSLYILDNLSEEKIFSATFQPTWRHTTNGSSLLLIEASKSDDPDLVTDILGAFSGEE